MQVIRIYMVLMTYAGNYNINILWPSYNNITVPTLCWFGKNYAVLSQFYTVWIFYLACKIIGNIEINKYNVKEYTTVDDSTYSIVLCLVLCLKQIYNDVQTNEYNIIMVKYSIRTAHCNTYNNLLFRHNRQQCCTPKWNKINK